VTHAELVAAGGALVGTGLSFVADLGGGTRCTVLRCRTAEGGTVVLKQFADRPDALACFTAEAAGLRLSRHGPELLAVDPAAALLVLSDLGSAPSLADVLTGTSAAGARAGLLAWAAAYGTLAAETAGREPELAALRARYDRGAPPWDAGDWIGARIAALPAALEALGVRGAAGVSLRLDEFPVFSPGDICPDNNLLCADGMRLLDFEGAGYRPVFLDAAYVTMPFATCWCVFRLPPAVVSEVDAVYRSHVAPVYPALADDEVWRDGVRRAVAAWTVDATVALGTRAAAGDRPLHPRRTPVPTIRGLLRHRWQTLADVAWPELPAFANLADRLLAASAGWGVEPLPLYPAFSAHGSR
jgi:hypothetical protein